MAAMTSKRKAAIKKWQAAGVKAKKKTSVRHLTAVSEFKRVYKESRARGAAKSLARKKAFDIAGLVGGKGNVFTAKRKKVEAATLKKAMRRWSKGKY